MKQPLKVHETLQKRGDTHGDFVKQGTAAQSIKEVFAQHGSNGLPRYQKETLDMIAVKISRVLVGNENFTDHWHDMAGYSTKVEEVLLELQK